MASNVERLVQTLAAFPFEDTRTVLQDPVRAAPLREAFASLAEPDFEVAMIASPGFAANRRGFDGFHGIWTDWLSPYETYRAEVEDIIDAADHVVTLVRQRGVPKGGVAEVESASAAVWKFRQGRLYRVEFHLDRAAALRAAGLGASAQSSHA